MRIAMVSAYSSTSGGGIWEVIRSLSEALLPLDIEVIVTGLADRGQRGTPEQNLPFDMERCAIVGPKAFGYSPEMLPRLLNSRSDVLHAHGLWMYPSVVGLRWHQRTQQPYIVSPHGMLGPWALTRSSLKKRFASILYQNKQLDHATCIHVLNEGELASVRASGLRNTGCVIPNGVALPSDGQITEIAPTWATQLPAGARCLFFLGRFTLEKNLQALVRGWKVAKEVGGGVGDSWFLVLAGWDHRGYERPVKTLAAELGVTRSVLFVGPQFGIDKSASFRRADAFVLPSLSEGLPMAALEAWAYGLPVLMTKYCNLPDGLECGAALEIGVTPDTIATGILSMFSMPETGRREMGARGRKLVEQKYTWASVAKSMSQVYAWLLGGARPDCVV